MEALLAAAVNLVFARPTGWLWDRLVSRRQIRIDVAEERGPTSREYGFTEKGIKVTVVNKGNANIEIRDVRLMFAKGYGFPVPTEAPPARSHPELPAALDVGAAEAWYFPAEKLASGIQGLAAESPTGQQLIKLRPHSHWP